MKTDKIQQIYEKEILGIGKLDEAKKYIQSAFGDIANMANSAKNENDVAYAMVRVAAILDKANMILLSSDNKKIMNIAKPLNNIAQKLRQVTSNGNKLP